MTKIKTIPGRLKIISLFLIVIIVLIGILTRVLFLEAKEDIDNDLNILIKDYVQANINSIDIFINNYENTLEALAESENILNIEAYTVNEDNSLKALENYQKSDEAIVNVYMGTETGNMYLYPPVTLPDWFVAKDRPWYINALDRSTILWNEPYIDAASSTLIISNALKVENNSMFVGVVASDISLINLMDTLKENNIDQTNELIIISDSNHYILHPNHELIGLQVLDQGLLDNTTEENGTFDYVAFEKMMDIPEDASEWENIIYSNLSVQPVKYAYYEKNKIGWTVIGIHEK
jgi:methyl-accepting chemotaxis protein